MRLTKRSWRAGSKLRKRSPGCSKGRQGGGGRGNGPGEGELVGQKSKQRLAAPFTLPLCQRLFLADDSQPKPIRKPPNRTHLLEVVLLADDRALADGAGVGLAADGVAVRVARRVVAAGEVVDLQSRQGWVGQ